jgi:hypothetical protein
LLSISIIQVRRGEEGRGEKGEERGEKGEERGERERREGEGRGERGKGRGEYLFLGEPCREHVPHRAAQIMGLSIFLKYFRNLTIKLTIIIDSQKKKKGHVRDIQKN